MCNFEGLQVFEREPAGDNWPEPGWSRCQHRCDGPVQPAGQERQRKAQRADRNASAPLAPGGLGWVFTAVKRPRQGRYTALLLYAGHAVPAGHCMSPFTRKNGGWARRSTTARWPL